MAREKKVSDRNDGLGQRFSIISCYYKLCYENFAPEYLCCTEKLSKSERLLRR